MTHNSDILIGRHVERKALDQIVNSVEAEFTVVYGRRRIGKTFLVNTFFDDRYAFKLTGLAYRTMAISPRYWKT